MGQQDTPALLRALADAGVGFIVVGGVAAIAHGGATFTRDLDVLARFDVPNLERVLAALTPLRPRFALHPARPALDRDAGELASFRNLYLTTDLGRLDILGAIPNGSFDDLASTAVKMTLAGVECLVLGLDALIDSKALLGRDKDKPVEAELRAIRDRLAAGGIAAGEVLAEEDDPA